VSTIRILPALAIVALPLLSGCAGMVIGAGATAGTAAAEERGLEGTLEDTKIRAQINEAWFRRDFEMYRKVGLTIHGGRVLLTGVVADDTARSEAARLSWQVAGVKEVFNEIEVVPAGQELGDRAHDTWIEEKLKAKLLFDKDIRNINYQIEVVNGVIYLMGVAQNEAEVDRVIAYARDIAHVRRVVNHVILKTDPRRVNG
jgi:osmotically-inducible protein OsmY